MRRFLGVLAAALGLTGAALAQPAIPISSKAVRPAYAQSRPTVAPQAKAETPAPPAPAPTPAVTPATPTPATPAATPAQANAGGCPSAIAADVAAACGEPAACVGACDCLCGPPGRFWFGADYLLWTAKGNSLPPLATTATGVPVTAPPPLPNPIGTLGTPGTAATIGGRNYNDEWRSGLRLYGGLWFDQGQRLGAEMDWFFLGESSTHEVAGGTDSNGYVFRPFTNFARRNADGTFTAVPAFQDTQIVQYPNVLAGTVAVDTQSSLWGLNPNAVLNLCCNPCGRLDFLIGYRYLNLQDDLAVREDLTGQAGSPNPGAQFVVVDRFRTLNQFNGVNLGLAWERRFGRLFLNVRGGAALGNTHTTVDIDGATTVTTAAGVSDTAQGGLLAQPSNIGHYTLDRFAVVPEVGVKLGVQVTDHLRVYAGYNFLYWSNVVRTGDMIDLRVNGSQLPPRTNVTGELFPRFEPRYSDFWVHGLVFGVQARY